MISYLTLPDHEAIEKYLKDRYWNAGCIDEAVDFCNMLNGKVIFKEVYKEYLQTLTDMTAQQAINYASLYGLQNEVQQCLDDGLTPEQALREWDL